MTYGLLEKKIKNSVWERNKGLSVSKDNFIITQAVNKWHAWFVEFVNLQHCNKWSYKVSYYFKINAGSNITLFRDLDQG